MEQFLNDNIYIIDLGDIDSAPEIIFKLSSVLDTEEVKNKRICLKLGNVDLNQAQLLSIKSLISGIDSLLSSIDTKSVETEKVALSLGIIVSNISAENTLDVSPEMTYKMADEIKEENQNMSSEQIVSDENVNNEEYVDENQNREPENEESEQQELKEENLTSDSCNDEQTNENEIKSENTSEDCESAQENSSDDVKDELDVIFGSTVNSGIFNMEVPEDIYEEREEIGDIVVPEQEYTKEDIELESLPTKYIKQTIRSGQVINYEGNVVIIGDCHPGCEISAFGDITVWGVLSGIAHAGAGGNQKARVRALKMNAIQLRIANCYSRRPDSLNSVYIEKTNSFTPEEARIINGEIVVFKVND